MSKVVFDSVDFMEKVDSGWLEFESQAYAYLIGRYHVITEEMYDFVFNLHLPR